MKRPNAILSQVEDWWHNLAEGWHDLSQKAEKAITRFSPNRNDKNVTENGRVSTVGWSLMPVEIRERNSSIIVELEVPGLEKKDFAIDVDDDCLRISGEKFATDDRIDGDVHVVERAYGTFQRTVPLPAGVVGSKAKASYRRGVLTVTIPRKDSAKDKLSQVVIR